MDDAVVAEERAYWINEVRLRGLDVEAARMRGDAPHILAGATLRLREAEERLAGMSD